VQVPATGLARIPDGLSSIDAAPLPLDRASEGYKRMMANQARYRVVLTVEDTGIRNLGG
jgi:hypothetical protein